MATQSPEHSEHEATEPANVWMTSFSDEDRKSQMEEDSSAWGHVAGLLLAVVIGGLLLALGAVWISGNF
jgi:hypothetical protein